MFITPKPLLTNFNQYECMKTKHNKWRNLANKNVYQSFINYIPFYKTRHEFETVSANLYSDINCRDSFRVGCIFLVSV